MRRVVVITLLPLWCAAAAAAQPSAETAADATSAPAPSEILGEEEAVLRVLQFNPSLRAFRKQRAVAENQIISATAIANPTLQLQLVHVQQGPQLGWTATMKWTPPQPVQWSAQRSQARAHLDEVRYAIAEQEWALATLTRTTHCTLLELREQALLYEGAMALRRRMVALIRTRVERGGATRLELNLAQLAVLYAQRDLDDVELRRTQAQSQLQELLGVTTVTPIEVRGPLPFDSEVSAPPEPALLAEQALAARPALKAALARVTQRKQALVVEKSRRWPWLALNGQYGETGSVKYPHDGQVGVELMLPVLNLNTGPIQVAVAELEQSQAVEQAQAQALKQSVYAACAELQVRKRIVERYRREVLPVLLEHERLMELAVRGAQVDLVALLSSEESVLRGQREYSDARLAYRRAWLALEAVVGTPLAGVPR